MKNPQKAIFDSAVYLASAGVGRRIVTLRPNSVFFSQGDTADCVFFLQRGRAKLTVLSQRGKEATITLLVASEFIGEEAVEAIPGLRLSTATAITECTALKIQRTEVIRVLHEQNGFAYVFVKFLLARGIRTQGLAVSFDSLGIHDPKLA